MHKTKRPYQLPEPLTCDLGEVADGVSVELAEEYIRRARQPDAPLRLLREFVQGLSRRV